VSREVMLCRKVADLEEIKTCTGSRLADGAAAGGPEEYFMKILIRMIW